MGSSAFSWILRRGGESPKAAETSRRKEPPEEEEFGVTEKLREFVRGFTVDTFKEFRLANADQDGSATSGDSTEMDHSYEASVQKDLTEWQEKHALLMLSSVKEMAKIRYALCPRHMKDKDFWTIYFLVVKKFIAPYELHAIQRARLKTISMKDQGSSEKGVIEVEMTLAKPLETVNDIQEEETVTINS